MTSRAWAWLLALATWGCGNGSGPSGSHPFISEISPEGAVGGVGAEALVAVTGTNFVPGSVVQWNGSPLATQFVNSGLLNTLLSGAELRRPGSGHVRVDNGADQGGRSNEVEFVVRYPIPQVATFAPSEIVAGSGPARVTITGAGFFPATRLRVDGVDHGFDFVAPNQIEAVLSPAELASSRVASLTVLNPSPGGGESAPFRLVVSPPQSIVAQRAFALQLHRLIYDPTRGRLIGGTATGEPVLPNAIVVIDPVNGAVERQVDLPFEPELMALSEDGRWLYVSARDDGVVNRVDLVAGSIDLSFRVDGFGQYEPTVAGGLAVVPGEPRAVLVAIRSTAVTPDHEGYVVFADGVPRSVKIGRALRANQVVPGVAPGEVLGFGEVFSGPFTLFRLRVDGNGVALVGQQAYPGAGGFAYSVDAGHLVTDTGTDIEIASGALRGALRLEGQGLFAADVAASRFYRMGIGVPRLEAYDTQRQASVGAVTIPGIGAPQGDLVRWSRNGLAFRTVTQLVILETTQATP